MSQEVLSFQAITATADGSGDYTESAGTAVTIRGELKMLDGFKKMAYTELMTKEVYQFDCFYNSVLTTGAIVTFGSNNLKIHAVVKNFEGFNNKVKIILYKI